MGKWLNTLREKLNRGELDQAKIAAGMMIAAVVIAAAAVVLMALSGIDIRGEKAPGEDRGAQTREEENPQADEDADPQAADAEAPEGDGNDLSPGGLITLPEEDEAETGNTDDTAPEAQASESETASIAGLVHAISAGEMESLKQTYDGTVKGFGIGLQGGARDSYNRQLQAVTVNSQLNALGANVLVFASDANTPNAGIAFQAGYEAGYTEKVLDILKQYDVKATFFVTMEYVTHNPDIITRMIDEGHEIGNHSATAPEDGIANYALDDQMNDALRLQNYMEEHFGYTMTKYNFNSGVYSAQQAILMTKMGYQFTFCSLNYDDYDPEKSFNSQEVLASLTDMMHNGCIYCFHMTNPVTVEILPGLLQNLKDAGYNIVSLR